MDSGSTKRIDFVTKNKFKLDYDVIDVETNQMFYKVYMNDSFERECIRIYDSSGKLTFFAFGEENWGLTESMKVYSVGVPCYPDQKPEDQKLRELFAKRMECPTIISEGIYEWGSIEGRLTLKIEATLHVNKENNHVDQGYSLLRPVAARSTSITKENGETCARSLRKLGFDRTIRVEYTEGSDILQLLLLAAFGKQMSRKMKRKKSIKLPRNLDTKSKK